MSSHSGGHEIALKMGRAALACRAIEPDKNVRVWNEEMKRQYRNPGLSFDIYQAL
jgi:hypothetical protein